MPVYTWEGKVLFREAFGSKIAIDPACCCDAAYDGPCPTDCSECCSAYTFNLVNVPDWFPELDLLPRLMGRNGCGWYTYYMHHYEGAPCYPSVSMSASINCVNDENGNAQWWLNLTVTGGDACGNSIYYEARAPIGTGQCPDLSGPFAWEPYAWSDPQDIPFDVTVTCND